MPSITEGLFAGRAGIQSHGAAISVLADNVANSNTVGFKSSRAEFVDLLAGTISGGGGGTTVGSGSEVRKVTQIFQQGTFEFTGRGLDLGIDGDGFFIVENVAGTRLYTRAGNLSIDSNGSLRDQSGNTVLGFPSSGTGALQELNVNTISTQSQPTTEVTLAGNLDASQNGGTGIDEVTLPVTFAKLGGAAEFSTFVDVFDSLGESHTVTLYFFGNADDTANTYDVAAYVDGSEINGGTAGTPVQLGATVEVDFGSDGTQATAADDIIAAVGVDWANEATDSDINFNLSPFTQFSTPSSISSITQDGSGTGSVTSFNVEEDGTLFALLDNGNTASVGKIALATFANPEGLSRTGDSLFIESSESGEPVVGTPAAGRFGALEAGALELSTSDIAADFIKLISLQRGFQSSSRIITNIDDLLNEIISLA